MLGAFAQAAIFIALLGLSVIAGSLFLAALASVLLTIIEQSAAGNDEVAWPDEPMLDRVWRAVHFIWLTAVWMAPAGLLIRLLTPLVAPEATALLVYAAIAAAFWLFFPVGMLSSLSAESPWVVFRPKVVMGLLRHFPAAMGFYAASAVLVTAAFAAVGLACVIRLMWLAPPAAILAVTALLIHARLLGRLGWVVGQTLAVEASTRGGSGAPSPTVKPARRPKRPRRPKAKVRDPWAIPDEPKPSRTPWGQVAEPVEGYALSADLPMSPPEEKPARKNHFPEENAERPYGMTPAEPPSELAARERPSLPEPDPVEMNRGKPPTLPDHPLLQGVYSFPWYGTTLRRWIWLSLLMMIVLVLVQLMIAAAPIT